MPFSAGGKFGSSVVKPLTGLTLLWGMAACLSAQQLTLGTVSKGAGQTASLSVQLATAGVGISALQFDLLYNPNVLTITPVLGAMASAAGKSMSTNSVAANDLRVLIVGFNQTLIGNGDVTDLTIQIAANATPGSYPLAFSAQSASNPSGASIALGATNGAITVTGSASPLTISAPATLGVATAGAAYTAGITATGGVAPYTWSATGLPGGLSIGAGAGTITGTPATNAGSPFTVQVTVTDSASATANKSYSLTVNAVLTITGPSSLPAGTVNAAYSSTTVTATGGTGVYTWSATGLPNGLSIGSTTGAITGTPTTNAGTPFTVVVTATDGNGVTANKSYSLAVGAAISGPAITGPASLPAGTVNTAYSSTTVTASGGVGAYTWSATGLPSGLSIGSTTGAITGTPTANAGSPFSVVVTVKDSNAATASKSYSLTVNGPVNGPLTISGPSGLPIATVGSAYPGATVTAAGGTAPYRWSATGLPPGMSIGSSTGTIAGTPTATGGPFSVSVTVTDSTGATASHSYTIAVNSAVTVSGPASLPAGTVNTAYPATTLTASGGSALYTWSATGLPAGLSLNVNSGAITGTPTATNGSPFTVQVTVTDSNGAQTGKSYSLTVNGPPAITGPFALPAGTVGSAYPGATVTATGGTGPFTWAATGLPAGLNIGTATGMIAGTPTTAGSQFTVKVTVTDSLGAAANRSYSVVVASALSISGPASLPAGMVGTAYSSTTIAATGGSGVYTWSAVGLPSGLSIGSTTGAITGTPSTNSGSPFNVQVTVTDSNSATASTSYTLTVNPAASTLPVISTISNSASGQAVLAPNTWISIYGSNFAPAGFTGDWSNSIVNGNLPTKLDGVSVTVGGQGAYVDYVSAGQINVLLPNVGLGPLQTTVTTAAGTSAPVTANAQQYSPAFFPWPNGQPVATHLDYSPAVKNGTFPGAVTVPAKPGEVIVLWCEGFGPTSPPAPVGVAIPATATYSTASAVTVTINGAPVQVYQGTATLAATLAGLYQIGITLPTPLPNGDYTLIASVNGAQTPAVTFTIQN
jgi:uncharacterized protein (TIGR03437 family)